MNKIKRRYRTRTRINVAITAIMAVIVVAVATVLGTYVDQAADITLTLTDDVIASMYLLALVFLYLLVSYLTPTRR